MKRATFIKRRQKLSRRDKIYTPESFRILFFKSCKHFYASLVDNCSGNVVFSVSTQKISTTSKTSKERISDLSKGFVSKFESCNPQKVSFDRGVYKYHGLVKQFVEEIRNNGVKV